MIQNVKSFYGVSLHSSDGKIGLVQEFYFDDRDWTVRYVVVDTGTWLLGRQVLISPASFGSVKPGGNELSVNLTRKQIEDSPPIEKHKPVSLLYEEEYHQYYGLPYYWQGGGLMSQTPFPVWDVPAPMILGKPDFSDLQQRPESQTSHLRSTRYLDGYSLHGTDGNIGHLSDFMMDTESWQVQRLVVRTSWFSHRVEVKVSRVNRISFDESTMFLDMTKEEIEKSPEYGQLQSKLVNSVTGENNE